MMAELNLKTSVSLKEASDMIFTCGKEVSFMLQGRMGIGKSSLLTSLAQRLPNYDPVYMDMTTKDLGDISGVPCIEEVNGVKVTMFAPNSELRLQSDRPVLLMLDEFGKAMRPVQNTCLRLLLERKMGEHELPKGSIVFATTNLATDGVGDSIQAHARNRMSIVTVDSPTADEWCEWAIDNDVAPEIISWVNQNPHSLASYDDPSQKENPYIFHPNKPTTAFVTPRSLTKASSIIKHRGLLGLNATIAGVAGCIGESAARDIMAYAELADKLPTWESIITYPEKAKVPSDSDAASSFITIYSAIARIERESFNAWMTYCKRLAKEYQAEFAMSVVKSNSKRIIAISNREFIKWATENQWVLDTGARG